MSEGFEISEERKSLFQDVKRLVVKLGTRVVTVGDGRISVETVSLRDAIDHPTEYVPENAWAQGTPEARSCGIDAPV